MDERFEKLWLAKAENFLTVNHDRFLQKPVVSGKPYIIFVDPYNGCNLRCPECLHSLWPDRYPPGRMSLDMFRTIMHEYGETAISLRLYNYGEPFLNPDVYEMVRIAKGYRIGTAISSNLNVCDPQKIVECGLDKLVLSIDGATQEIYQIYRRKGQLEKVLSNIKAIVAEKKRTGSTTPVLYWQFLTFEHNHHEIETARKMSADLGVEYFYTGIPQTSGSNSGLKAWNPDKSKKTAKTVTDSETSKEVGPKVKEACRWPWQAISITATGDVFPCCVLWDHDFCFDNIAERQEISTLFNGKRFEQVRRFFSKHHPFPMGEECKTTDCLCELCNDRTHNIHSLHCESCTFFAGTYVIDAGTVERDLGACPGLADHDLSTKISKLQDSLTNIQDSTFSDLAEEIKLFKNKRLNNKRGEKAYTLTKSIIDFLRRKV